MRASSGMMGTTRGPMPGSRSRLRRSLAKAIVVDTCWSPEPLVELARRPRHPAWPAVFGRTTRRGSGPPSAAPALLQVADLRRVGTRMVVGRFLELLVGDGQLQAVAKDAQLLLVELLGLVRDVACLDAGAQRPALDRLGQDDGRRAVLLGGGLVGGIELAVVVAAAAERLQLVVGLVVDEPAQARVGAEEVLAHVGAAGSTEYFCHSPSTDVGHALHEHAVRVAGQQLVPLAAPDDLDDVPAGAAEDSLQLLDDLAVATHRPVEALQVAVDDEDEVVEPLAGGDRERAQRLRLVRLAVAQEGPHAAVRGVLDAAVVQVAVEARLVDGRDRARGPWRPRGTPRSRA